MFKIPVVDLVNAPVDDRFLHRIQAFLPTDDQLAQRQNKIRLQGDRVVIIRIIHVDIHRIDVLVARRRDLDDLSIKPPDQCRILRLRIRDDDIVIRHEEGIRDLPLCGKRFAGSRCPEDQPIRVFELLPIHHDEVVGEGIQAVVQRACAGLEEFLRGKGNKDRCAARGHCTLNLDFVMRKRQG